MIQNPLVPAALLLAVFFTAIFAPFPAHAEDRIEQPVKDAIDIRQKTQKRQEAWRQEKQRRLARLEALQKAQERLKSRKEKLKDAAQAAKERIADKKKQIADIDAISGEIQPFLEKLLKKLKTRIDADLAFLPEERIRRIEKLDRLIADPEAATSQKYRKMMEALLIEAEYGFTNEVYQQTISVEGQKRLVNIFRLGRLNLFYLTLDHAHCGFYNIAEKTWEPLSGFYLPQIQAAVDIAAKRRTAEMLTLPLGRIKTQ
ncbi:MAG: DUF3450 domain-containing protein [Desulfosalsimonadaceae bacterium]